MNETGQLHFKIGEGLSDLVRDAFWYELRFDWAKEVLRCFEGINEEQINKILGGDARLKPIEDGRRVELVYEEDKIFKEGLAEHAIFVKEKIESLHKEIYEIDKIKDKAEFGFFQDENAARIRLLSLDRITMINKTDELANFLVYYDILLGKKVLPDLTTKVGGYEIPNNLLDEYVNDVVGRIRASLRMGSIMYENPLEMIGLEERRRILHERILCAVGFTKNRRHSQKYQDFAEALQEFLESMGAGLYKK